MEPGTKTPIAGVAFTTRKHTSPPPRELMGRCLWVLSVFWPCSVKHTGGVHKEFQPTAVAPRVINYSNSLLRRGCFMWGQSWKQAHGNDIHQTSFKSLDRECLFSVISNTTIAADDGGLFRDAASVAGPVHSQWLARRVDWQQKQHWIRCGQCLIIPHSGQRIAFVMLVSLQKGAAVSPAAGTTQRGLHQTAAAGRQPGMLSVSSEAWSQSKAAESKCNRRLSSVGFHTRMPSDFKSLWRNSAARHQPHYVIYTIFLPQEVLQLSHVVKELRMLEHLQGLLH